MQQYISEHQRAEVLQQKVEELKEHSATKDDLLNQFQRELRNAVPKLNMAIQALKTLPAGPQRDRCLEILRQTCTNEMAVLNELPNLQDFLTPENIQLLRHLNLIGSQTEKNDLVREEEIV
jgi:CHASE3 domain sensor protein